MFEPKIRKIGDLRVVLVKDDRQAVMVNVLVGSGSREERDNKFGVAHFLEHFVFKGTAKFPGMMDVNEAVEKVGGKFNAYTSLDRVGFWVNMDKKHLGLAVKILGQVVGEPLLSKKYFDKERGTILEELYMYEDHPSSKAGMEAGKLLFGEGSSLGRPIIGTVDSLKSLSVSDLSEYMNKWFVPSNMILGVVGDYGDESSILSLVEAEFASVLKRPENVLERDVYSWKKKAKMRSGLVKRKVEQAHVAFALPGLPLSHKLRWTACLVNVLFGAGWMSKLMREVREKRGWAYAIRSGVDFLGDVGEVSVMAGLPKNKMPEAVSLIIEIMTGLSKGKWAITEDELGWAKESYKGRLSLSFDSPQKVLEYALSDLMFENKIYSIDELKENISRVSLSSVGEYCEMVFERDKLSIAVVGDYEKLPAF